MYYVSCFEKIPYDVLYDKQPFFINHEANSYEFRVLEIDNEKIAVKIADFLRKFKSVKSVNIHDEEPKFIKYNLDFLEKEDKNER